MGTTSRLAAFAAALALAFGGAWGLGVLVGPIGPAPAAAAPMSHDMAGMDMGEPTHASDHDAAIGTDGLASSARGWTLVPTATTFTPGTAADFGFTVRDDAGNPVTTFTGAAMPLVVVVRRDAAGLQVLTPTLATDLSWHAPLKLPAPGVYRAFVQLGGPVLGVDLFGPGPFTPFTFPPSRTAEVDGFQVRLDGDLVAGRPSQVFATVSRGGVPVTDLEPYGAGFGRLTVLRQGDLAYATGAPGDGSAPPPAIDDRSGPALAFTTTAHSAGTYRLFLQFRENGHLHMAEFTIATRAAR